jgi:hypothetical protein
MGRGNDAEPLQLRMSTLEDTVDSVHTTVHALETTMSEIVTLLRDKQPKEARKPQTERPVAPSPADEWLPKLPPIASPQIGTSRPPVSYRETAVPTVSNTTTPTGFRGLRPNGTTTLPNDSEKKSVMDQRQPNGIPDFDSALKSPMGQRQRRRQEFLSGHYWHPRQFDIHVGKAYSRFQVAWLHHNIDGPYEGKPDKLQKLSLSLADDSTKSFLRFYAAARAGLGACGYHEELLPTLSTARVGFDVRDSPIMDEDLLTVGKTIEIDEPPRDHWQSQHDTLGMNLYPLMEFAIKETAKRSRHLIDNSVTLGNPNGLNIIHDLLRYHHPRVLDSLAPSFDNIYRDNHI